MENFTVDLYKEFNLERKADTKGYLTCFLHKNSREINEKRLRPAMVVIPGGGYAYCSEREAEPIAFSYFSNGYNSFVLDYSVGAKNTYPCAFLEACMAMAYIRKNSDKLHVKSDNVAAIGFSAGGHLCGCLATLTNEKVVKDLLGNINVKPDAVVLSYSVITSDEKLSHKGSFDNIIGGDENLRKYLSLEDRVNENSSPAFIWHTVSDNCVPVENSFLYASACQKYQVPFELHLYRQGPHGLSTCNNEVYHSGAEPVTTAGSWLQLSLNFLTNLGFQIKE